MTNHQNPFAELLHVMLFAIDLAHGQKQVIDQTGQLLTYCNKMRH